MKENTHAQLIEEKFKSQFNSEPLLIRSPGRINLIGEHTDYNDGFVFPAAIDKEVYFAVAKNDIGKFRFFSFDFDAYFELEISELSKSDTDWANYLIGVAAQFIKKGHELSGIDCVFGGNIPIGAGLSSSAALENGFALALNELFECRIEKLDLALMSQKAEHEYAGVMCGIMDQFASMFGRTDQAIKLDCRSLEFEYAKIELSDYQLLLINTNVSHKLASSEYNTRRKECEAGVNILTKHYSNIKSLRDVNTEVLNKHADEFSPTVFKRCEFVVNENKRVNAAFDALANNNIQQLGELIYQSHEGLRDKYEVSCKELDLLVEIAKQSGQVIGARMMGGGFGGCTINLVKKEHVNAFTEKAKSEYKAQTGIDAEVHLVKIVDGTEIINLSST